LVPVPGVHSGTVKREAGKVIDALKLRCPRNGTADEAFAALQLSLAHH
jgi:hypothetical protein